MIVILLLAIPLLGAASQFLPAGGRGSKRASAIAALGVQLGLALSVLLRGTAESRPLFEVNLTITPLGALLAAIAALSLIVALWAIDAADAAIDAFGWLGALGSVMLMIEASGSLPTASLGLILAAAILATSGQLVTPRDVEAQRRFLAWIALAGVALIFASALDTLSQQPGRFAVVPTSLAGPTAALLFVGIGIGLAALPFFPWLLRLGSTAPEQAGAAAGLLGTGTAAILLTRTAAAPWLLDQPGARPVILIAAGLGAIACGFLALGTKHPARLVAILAGASADVALAALATSPTPGLGAVGAILVAQVPATVVAFAVLSGLDGKLSGAFRRRPILATGLAIAGSSLVGLPPTLGYAARLLAVREAVLAPGLLPAAMLISSLLGGLAMIRAWLPIFDRSGAPREPIQPLDLAILVLSLALVVGGIIPDPPLDSPRPA